jgi:HEPN domain-containing protein
MKQLTGEWVAKAEADLGSAQREYRARSAPNFDLACFLAQQCIEKYLKARLQEADIAFGKTHNLALLLNQAATVEPTWSSWSAVLHPLSAYATEFRYPGRSATKDDARAAIDHARTFRATVRGALGIPVPPTRRSVRKKGGRSGASKKRTKRK